VQFCVTIQSLAVYLQGGFIIEYKWLCIWIEWQWPILWHQDVHHKSWQKFASLLHHDSLSTFTTDSSGKLYVLRHDGHTLGVNSAQVGVFKQTHQVGLACFLRTLPTKHLLTLLTSPSILCTINKNLYYTVKFSSTDNTRRWPHNERCPTNRIQSHVQ